MQHRRQHVVQVLRKTGFPEIADAGLRVLPDPVEVEDVEKFLASFGITCGMFGRWLGSRRLRFTEPPLLFPPALFSDSGRSPGAARANPDVGRIPFTVPRRGLSRDLRRDDRATCCPTAST